MKVVHEHGGIYLDTDVELLKSLDRFLSVSAFFGFEDDKYVATGLGFGALAGHEVLHEMMKDYATRPFVLEDGTCDTTPCPRINTHVLENRGLMRSNARQILPGEILILPREYLCPINYETGILRRTRRTISIHWYAAAWLSEEQKRKRDERQKAVRKWIVRDAIVHAPNRLAMRLLGMKKYEQLKQLLKR